MRIFSLQPHLGRLIETRPVVYCNSVDRTHNKRGATMCANPHPKPKYQGPPTHRPLFYRPFYPPLHPYSPRYAYIIRPGEGERRSVRGQGRSCGLVCELASQQASLAHKSQMSAQVTPLPAHPLNLDNPTLHSHTQPYSLREGAQTASLLSQKSTVSKFFTTSFTNQPL